MDFEETRVPTVVRLGDGSEAWAFIEEEELDDDVASAFTGHFGLGFYRNTGSAVETMNAFWVGDAAQLGKDQ